ncbi:MAG: AmmeMemoRadiSam system radical SAM enzyme [Candidatus Delongbacteria bacterium]|nr:AmmeMemoRadiSam system radical SAM enzyme [Candidatus Delongbacteria bacterium]MCG2759835.1 AmmeMemoRadiSam system radical SAM enzyme [Candidatus Delongbacteria bacterium]
MELFKPAYFQNLEDGRIKCLLCERRCVLNNGQKGFCGANKNNDNELKNLVYGRPAALNIDPIEKKPLYHFLKGSKTYSLGTIGCNFKCSWCQNYHISQKSMDENLHGEVILPEKIVTAAIQSNCLSISYTYNEPAVFYPYARDVGLTAKENGLKNVFVSNGYQTDSIIQDMKNWVDAINVDLKCFEKDKHKKYTGGDMDIVLRNLRSIADSPIHLEITTLVIPDINDSDTELSNIADFIAKELGKDIPWHVSAFHPDYKMTDRNFTQAETIYRAIDIGLCKGLKFVYPGNIF